MSEATPGTSAPGGRCFLALLPDADGRQALARYRDSLVRCIAGGAHGVRFIESTALHLTMRFLGDSSNAQVEYLKHMLPILASALPTLTVQRHAVWPNRARPRSLVLELAAHAALSSLARGCEAQACKAGYAPEPHGFRAHVTLARLRPGVAFGTLPNPTEPVGFDALALLRSTLAQQGSSYTELARIELPRHS